MSPSPGQRGAVLVVEDDADAREALCELLAAQGFTALHAGDGASALALLLGLPYDEHRLDAILLDLKMPRVDGWVFLGELRANRYLREIPVLVISAAEDEGVPAGAAGRFQKPVEHGALLAAVASLCGAREQRGDAQPAGP